MDDLNREITLLKANIAMYNTKLNTAISPEDERLLLQVITESTRRLNRLLDEKKAQYGGSENRLRIVMEKLRKCKVNVDSSGAVEVLKRLGRSELNLEIASYNTDFAYQTYLDVKEAVHSETKSYIGTVLGMNINGCVFDDFPFILSAWSQTGELKMIKVLRVPDGTEPLARRLQEIKYELESVKFKHPNIVPFQHVNINVTPEIAVKASCRPGENDVLIMPWYVANLTKLPSHCLELLATQASNVWNALNYLHEQGYVHMDVKAMNIFLDASGTWFLGDFGSCKPIDEPILSCTIHYCWEDVRGQLAHPKFDYFMFLVMLLIECMDDRRHYKSKLCDENGFHVTIPAVIAEAKLRIYDPNTPQRLSELLLELGCKLKEFNVSYASNSFEDLW